MTDAKITPKFLASRVAAIKEIDQQIDSLDDARQEYAAQLERAAHALLQARSRYSRTGMYPRLYQGRGAVTYAEAFEKQGAVYFEVSNGIDHGDDFGVSLTFEELCLDPEAEAQAEAERRKGAERQRLIQRQRDTDAALRRLEG